MNRVKPRWISNWAVMPIIFMVSLPFANAEPTIVAEESVWAKTDISQEKVLNQFFSLNECSQSSHWMGCMFSYGTILAANAKAKGQIYFIDKAQASPEVEVIATCRSTSLVSWRNPPEDNPSRIALHNRWRVQSLQILEALNANQTTETINSFSPFVPSQTITKAAAEAFVELSCYRSKVTQIAAASPLTHDQMAMMINTWAQFVHDGHSRFLPSVELKYGTNDEPVESFAGIGIVLNSIDNRFLVHKPIKGGPSDGVLYNGDEVIAVNGVSTSTFKDMVEFVSQVKGPVGTTVEITVARYNGNIKIEKTIKIVRQKVERRRVEFNFNPVNKQLHIELTDFNAEDICSLITSEIQTQKPSRVVLDLRSNGGGLLHMANCITGLFVGAELPLTQQIDVEDAKNGTLLKKPELTFSRKNQPFTYRGPMVVIVDDFSASASEVVSSALQDYGRAIIVGERTFGKGSAQTPKKISLFNNVLLMSTASFWTSPSGRSVHAKGVVPDIEVLARPDKEDYRNGGSIEENVSWLGVKPFDKPLLKNILPKTTVKLPSSCLAITGRTFATFDEMIKNVKGDYQMDVANRALGCLNANKYAWEMPASNRLAVYNNEYNKSALIRFH